MFTLMKQIVTSPEDAFASLKQTPNWVAIAFLIAILVAISSWVSVGQAMDTAEVSEAVQAGMAASPELQGMTEEESEQAMEAVQQIAAVAGPIGAALVQFIGFFVVVAVLAGVFLLSAKAEFPELSYSHWMSMVSWARIPLVLTVVVVVVGSLLGYELGVTPLAFAAWLPSGTISPDWMDWATTFDIPMVLSIVLMVIGYRTYTGRSMGYAVGIVLAPYIVYMGITGLWNAMF